MTENVLHAAACPNCGAADAATFCPQCGQSARGYLRPTRELADEFVSEQLALDSRLWRTLRALFLSPGLLTQEFVRGKRASYVSPVRLYLLVSVAFFTVLSLVSHGQFIQIDGPGNAAVAADQDDDFLKLLVTLTPEQRVRARAIMQQRGLATPSVLARLDAMEKRATNTQASSTITNRVHDHMLDLLENPQKINDTAFKQLPMAVFFTLPLYAACLKLFYPSRFYVEHLVFALHLHAFVFGVGIVVLLLPETAVGRLATDALRAVGALYYFVALKRVQSQSLLRTALKFISINGLHAVVIGIVIVLTVLLLLIL